MNAVLRRIIASSFVCSIVLTVSGCAQRDSGFDAGTIVVVGGDTHFGEAYPRSYLALKGDGTRYRDSLTNLKPVVTRAAFAFVNLETPLSSPRDNGLAGKDYVHWADPEKTMSALADAGVDAVGLANNHSVDQGQAGLNETLGHLSDTGIAAFGAGPDLPTAEAPLLRTIRRPGGKDVTLAIFGMLEERPFYRTQFKFYAEKGGKGGVAPFDLAAFGTSVAKLRAQYPDVYVVAFPHWGANYAWANQGQVDLSRKLVDAGADIVIGQGAHTLQEAERYHRKWILYGIGNFVFQAPGRYAQFPRVEPYGLLVELSFGSGANTDPAVRLRPFLTDNVVSHYMPRPTNAKEAAAIFAAMQARPRSVGLKGRIVGGDGHGAAIELASGLRSIWPILGF